MSIAKYRETRAKAMSEDELLTLIVEDAHAHGWLVAHFRPALTKDGRWVTAMTGDKGFPDLVLAKEGRTAIVAELKREGRKPETEQERWLAALAYGALSFCWHPSDWLSGEVRRWLE